MGQATRYVYEPFNSQWAPALQGELEHFSFMLQDAQPSAVVRHIGDKAFRGQVGSKQFLRALYRGYWRSTFGHCRQVVVKDPTAVLMVDWIEKVYGARTVYLVRHPCGFASSIDLLAWQLDLRRLLDQRELMDNYLNPYADILQRCQEDPWERLAAYWGAIHTVIASQLAQHPGRLLCHYESLCLNPQGELDRLTVGLELPALVAERRGSGSSADPGSTRRDSEAMADIWKQRLSPQQVDAVLGVVGEFDLGQLL